MKRLIPFGLLVLVLSVGCASLSGARHGATTGTMISGATLDLIQDTETKVVCGRAGAPAPPVCVPLETHKVISQKLHDAYVAHADLVDLVAAIPAGQQLSTPEIQTLVAKVEQLVADIIALIPQSPPKAKLVSALKK
jgi:hypothetical protein